MSYLVNPYLVSAPCVDKIWDQTDGSTQVDWNSNMRGNANNVGTGNAYIGTTITSFKIELKETGGTSDVPMYFGVWASGNNDQENPTAVFTGSIDNYNDLTTSFTWYTFTGSRTLVYDDHIGFCVNSAAPNIKQSRAENVAEGTIPNSSFTARAASNPNWWNYNAGQILNMEVYQTC